MAKQCPACEGKKACTSCEGTGINKTLVPSVCQVCRGAGKCLLCGGAGAIPES